MNKTITLAMAVVLFVVGAFVGNKIGANNAERLTVKSGTAMYEVPSAASERKMLARNIDTIVLEKVKYGVPSMVYLNDDIAVKADTGETYKLKQGSYFKFVGVNEADDMVTIFAVNEEGNNIQLDVPKQKVYPVDEGEWSRVREGSIGEKWVRTQSSWYDNI